MPRRPCHKEHAVIGTTPNLAAGVDIQRVLPI
jgi:hypothetical protein